MYYQNNYINQIQTILLFLYFACQFISSEIDFIKAIHEFSAPSSANTVADPPVIEPNHIFKLRPNMIKKVQASHLLNYFGFFIFLLQRKYYWNFLLFCHLFIAFFIFLSLFYHHLPKKVS